MTKQNGGFAHRPPPRVRTGGLHSQPWRWAGAGASPTSRPRGGPGGRRRTPRQGQPWATADGGGLPLRRSDPHLPLESCRLATSSAQRPVPSNGNLPQ